MLGVVLALALALVGLALLLPPAGAVVREALLRTVKERFNYASCDCAARVLATNAGAKSSSAVLQSQKDSYLLNLCSYPAKHIVIELCQDIRIDTLVLANFEFFSSTLRHFRVHVSKKFPPQPSQGGWRHVGSFTAENSRREQLFHVTAMNTYARYVRIDFDTHYGNEYYCLLSAIMVYGKTMIEDFEEESAAAAAGAAAGQHADSKIEPPSPLAAAISTAMACNARQTDAPCASHGPEVPFAGLGGDRGSAARETGLLDLFREGRGEGEPEVCSASPPPVSMQENIFKALHDRLHHLERNVTRSARDVDTEVRRLELAVGRVEEEVVAIALAMAMERAAADPALPLLQSDPSTAPTENGPKPSLLQRSPLWAQLEGRAAQSALPRKQSVAEEVAQTRSDGRLVFWIAVLCTLQIGILTVSVALGAALGSRGRPRPPQGAERPAKREPAADQWRPSAARVARGITTAEPAEAAEQLVPDGGGQRLIRGLSPVKTDLIASARTLILDDDEADLIDANYLTLSPTPSNGNSTERLETLSPAAPSADVAGAKAGVQGRASSSAPATPHPLERAPCAPVPPQPRED